MAIVGRNTMIDQQFTLDVALNGGLKPWHCVKYCQRILTADLRRPSQ
jgi:hypothetical protein